MPRSRWFATAVLAVSTLSRAASAQTAPATDDRCPPGEARAAFEQGHQAFAERRWADAARDFERSLACRPLAVVNYNLALAYRGLGRRLAAIEAFQRYLDAPEASATPERLQAIRDEMAEIRQQVVELTVSAIDPPGAQLRVDDRAWHTADGAPLSFSAASPLRLDPGPHVLTWTAPEHAPVRWSEDFRPGYRDVRTVSLPWLQEGRLVVEPSVPTAVVYVDRERVGVGRYASEALPPGRYALEIRADGYQVFQRSVEVGRTGVVRVDAALARRALPGWVVPVSVVGGLVVAGAIVATVFAVNESGPRALYTPTWTRTVEGAPVTP